MGLGANPSAYKTDAMGRKRPISLPPRRTALWFWQERYEEVKCRDCKTVFTRLLNKRGSAFRTDSERLLCVDCFDVLQRTKVEHIWREHGDLIRALSSERMKQRWRDDPEGMRELTKINDPDRLREQSLKNWADPAYRKRMSAARKLMWQDPAYAVKMSEARLRLWRTMAPEMRARIIGNLTANVDGRVSRETMLRLWENPSHRMKMSLLMRQRWRADPEHGARLTAMINERWQDPDFRAKMKSPERRELLKRKAEEYYTLAAIGEELASFAGYTIPVKESTNKQAEKQRRKSKAAQFAKQLI